MTLLSEIQNTVKINQPFMIEDISSSNFSYDTIRSMLSLYVKRGDIRRYCQGVYYLPKRTIFGETKPTLEEVVKRKYISNKKDVYGYYSGMSLLNGIGLSMQVPIIPEITSTKETTRKKTYVINGRRVITRSSNIRINKNNYLYLQFLDIFRYATDEEIQNRRDNVIAFFKEKKLKVEELKKVELLTNGKIRNKFRRLIGYDELA